MCLGNLQLGAGTAVIQIPRPDSREKWLVKIFIFMYINSVSFCTTILFEYQKALIQTFHTSFLTTK